MVYHQNAQPSPPIAGGSGAPALELAGLRAPVGLLRQMPAVIWAVDPDLRFTLSEGGGLAGLDLEPGAVVGQSLFEFFATTDPEHPAIAAHLRALAGGSATYELDWSGRTYHASVEPLRDQNGQILSAIGFAIDITERTLVEEELRQAEARYRTLVEQLPAIVYVAGLGPGGEWLYVSPRIREVLGYSAKEWMSEADPLASRLHPEDRDRVLGQEERCRARGLAFASEYRVRAGDGRWVWIRDEAVPVPHVPELRQGLMFDVTTHRQGQEARHRAVKALQETDLKRRELLSRLVSAREEEQRRIAGDVHDGPVQMMVAAGLRLQMLRSRLADPADLRIVDELARTVQRGTQELRRLIFELVPPTLEAEGLTPAVTSLLDRLSEEDGIAVTFEERLVAEPEEPARTVCFRILQEALRNIRKHAGAGKVQVLVETVGGEVHARIGDDGRGFDPEEAVQPGHYGVAGMHERAAYAGGRLELVSAPGEGTTVEFWIPERG